MTISGGYILISRKLIESEIYDKPPLYMKVWVYLLSEAQFKPYKKLKRGQLFTSIPEIQEACSWYVGFRKETPSKSKIYRIIDWLRKSGERVHEGEANEKMIETAKATQGMVVTIVNYNYYQNPNNYEHNTERNDEEGTNETRPQQERNNINKECSKNVKERKNDISSNSASNFELKILNTFKQIDKYPFDFERDIEHLRDLMTDYPQVDILRQAKKWKSYKMDKPLTKKSNARLQFRNWIEKAIELGQVKTKKKSEKDRIKKAKEKQIKRAEEYG